MNCEGVVYNCSTVVVTIQDLRETTHNPNTLAMKAKKRGDAISKKKYANIRERRILFGAAFDSNGRNCPRQNGGRIRIEIPFPSATAGGLNSL